MKYIRTKDYGICEVTNEDKLTISYKNSWISGCLWKESYKDQIQYADTIEELSDAFIIKWKNETYCKTLMDSLDQAKYWLKQDNYAVIYGAIWTDKGLIYVAKMNDKGELELL